MLRETEPIWLPSYALADSKPLHIFSLIGLGFALLKELSGEAHVERAQQTASACSCARPVDLPGQHAEAGFGKRDAKVYVESVEQRFKGVNRCC